MSKFNDNAILPYYRMLDDIKSFKTSGTAYDMDENFNMFDTPAHKYFKIMFYFGSTAEANDNDIRTASGLLAPTWQSVTNYPDDFLPSYYEPDYYLDDDMEYDYYDNQDVEDYIRNSRNDNISFYNYNSAWAYLKMNDENERAEKLEQFITLLSDISSKSPWYFSSVGGLQEALERKVAEDGKLEVADKKLTITCLPDAYDNRIGTLLELYRDVTWSWVHKKEIIPANLRKFDMAIYIFETPDHKLYNKDNFKPSYKMIEFHDCEFNYNSIKSAWSELNNVDGISPKYTIDITYADCYEISYNNIMMRAIGDVILTDMINASKQDSAYESKAQGDDGQYTTIKSLSADKIPVSSLIDAVTIGNAAKSRLIATFGNLGERSIDSARSDSTYVKYKEVYEPGFLANAVGQVAGHLVADTKSLVNRALLGNIYTLSLTQIGSELSDLAKGNLIKTGMTAGQYLKKFENGDVTEKQRKLMAYEKPEFGFDKKKFIHKGEYTTPTHVDNIFMDDYDVCIEEREEDKRHNSEAIRAHETGNIYKGDKTATDNTGRKPIVVNKASKQLGNIFSASTLANNL